MVKCQHQAYDHGKQISWWSYWYEIYDHEECVVAYERKCYRCQHIERVNHRFFERMDEGSGP